MKNFVLDEIDLSTECIEIKELMNNSTHSISISVFEEILFNDYNYQKLIKYLKNNNIYEFRIFHNYNVLLKTSKISFLEACLLYLKKYNYEDIEKYKELSYMLSTLNFINYINTKEIHNIVIDNVEYKINILSYYEFLTSNSFDNLITKTKINNIPIEKFVYALISYFENKKIFFKYNFPLEIKKRYLNLKNNQIIDYQSINKILETKDKYQKKVRVSYDIFKIINKKYDINPLKNIIKCYLELCKIFAYDEKFFIDSESDESLKHYKISYLPYVNKKNNKIVCYEFPEIFGAFLNINKIIYEIVGGNDFYGLKHNYLIFRYGKFLIRVEPVKNIYNTDFTSVKINSPLIGITCINENEKTKKEFESIVNECYQAKEFSLENDYLPSNKIEDDKEIDDNIKKYLVKIDLIIKKINEIDLQPVEKYEYFKQLIKYLFSNEELKNNIFYSVVSDYYNLIYVIIINPDISISNDNLYLIYKDNKLSIIDVEELRQMFKTKKLIKISKKEILGIEPSKKRS